MPASVAQGVYDGFPLFVTRKRRDALASQMLDTIAQQRGMISLDMRPLEQPNPRQPSAIPLGAMAPQQIEQQAKLAEDETAALLGDPEMISAEYAPATRNLAAIAAAGLRRGKPALISQAMQRIGGTALQTEYESEATRIQRLRGEDGRFASPEAAAIGAAIMIGAKREIGTLAGTVDLGGGSPQLNQFRPEMAASKKSTGTGQVSGAWLDWLKDTFGDIADQLQDWWNSLPSWIRGWWDTVEDFVSEVGQWLGGLTQDFGEWFADLADEARKRFVELCKNVAETAEDAWETVKRWVSRLEDLVDLISECTDDIWDCIMNAATWLIDWLIDKIFGLVSKFARNALRAIVWIFGELGKRCAGRLEEINSEARAWIKGEFKSPLDSIVAWIWRATWEPLQTGLLCLCEPACIQPVAKNLKEAGNPWVSLIGKILWYLYPLLQGRDNPDDFPGEDMRPYSFCRWYLQGGGSLLPGVELEGTAESIFDYFAEEYDIQEPISGRMYSKYMVDRVARRYAATHLLGLGKGAPGVDGWKFGQGPTTLFLNQEKTALWYAKHPKVARDHADSGFSLSVNPWPARVGLRARELAIYMVDSYCKRPEEWLEWLEDFQAGIHEIPGEPPKPGCRWPLGRFGDTEFYAGDGGRCIYTPDWYRLLRAARQRLEEKCFDLNGREKYERMRDAALWNWNSLPELARDSWRDGYGSEADLLAGFSYEKICPADLAQWRVPRDAGEPSVWDMGWPTWQGTGHGFKKHPGPDDLGSGRSEQYRYWSYYMDWLEANTRQPAEPAPESAQQLSWMAQTGTPGSVRVADLEPIPEYPTQVALSSGRTLWESIRMRRSGMIDAQFVGGMQMASLVGSIGAMEQVEFVGTWTMPAESRGVGYETAHARYQEIWKALTPAERREWLADNLGYYVYNPEGPPEAPEIQEFPGQNKFEVGISLPQTAGQWSTPMPESQQGAPETSVGLGVYHTRAGMTLEAQGVPRGGGDRPSGAPTPQSSSTAALKQMFSDPGFEWGLAPMTRRRFWAGEMMAHFEGTPYSSLEDLNLEALVLSKVGEGDGETFATPLLSFAPSDEKDEEMADEQGFVAFGGGEINPSEPMQPAQQGEETPRSAALKQQKIEIDEAKMAYVGKSKKSTVMPWVVGGGLLIAAAGFYIVNKR